MEPRESPSPEASATPLNPPDLKADADTTSKPAPQETAPSKPALLLPRRVLKPKYVPFNVHNVREGGLAVLGWQLTIWVAFVSSGLYILYELLVINTFDRDVRDMYFDSRLLQQGTNYYHKYFINAETCCNTDAVFFNYTCVKPVFSPVIAYPTTAPFCPPRIMMECPGLISAACNATRLALYTAAGLSPTGQYVDCSVAGGVLVGSESPTLSRPLTLQSYYKGVLFGTPFAVPEPFNINQTALSLYVKSVAAAYPDPQRMQPNHPLSRSLRFADGSRVVMAMPTHPVIYKKGLKIINPWALWPWPGMNHRCSHSQTSEQFYIQGVQNVLVLPYNYTNAGALILDLTFANQSLRVPMYSLTSGYTGDVANSVNLDQVALGVVSIVQILVGQVPPLGSCYGWRPSQAALNITYRPILNTSFPHLLTLGAGAATNQSVTFLVYDMSGPQYIGLPHYYGILLLFTGIGLAGIWFFGLCFFILIPMPLIWWNVRDNMGLPPVVYRYMRRYRGW